MRILLVDAEFPMFDRSSGGLRMFTITRLLVEQGHTCVYCVLNLSEQLKMLGVGEVERYSSALKKIGVLVNVGGLDLVLMRQAFDIVFFEFFYVAEAGMKAARLWQPRARVIVDSVDIHYERLFAKAALTGLKADYSEAENTKKRELTVYAEADLVITITEEDTQVLQKELKDVKASIIPNIHEIPIMHLNETDIPEIIFIGSFTHEPNIDAVIYFAKEIWPKVKTEVPATCWTIIGGNPPEEIRALASDSVIVTGYVLDTLPHLLQSWVSIAPLRYGAGMKGKVGEAMAAGTPVVTTTYGAQGIGAIPGKHLLLGDEPATFASHVISLLLDKNLRKQIGETDII